MTGSTSTGVSKRYGEVVALRNMNLDVRAGELYGFVGSNGAGKTTAMRINLGVLAPDAGEVRWAGRPLTLSTRRRIGYLSEERCPLGRGSLARPNGGRRALNAEGWPI